MNALLLKNDGYAREHSGNALEAMEPYVEPATIEVPSQATAGADQGRAAPRSIRPT